MDTCGTRYGGRNQWMQRKIPSMEEWMAWQDKHKKRPPPFPPLLHSLFSGSTEEWTIQPSIESLTPEKSDSRGWDFIGGAISIDDNYPPITPAPLGFRHQPPDGEESRLEGEERDSPKVSRRRSIAGEFNERFFSQKALLFTSNNERPSTKTEKEGIAKREEEKTRKEKTL